MSVRKEIIIGQAFGIGSALAYAISSVLIKQGVTGLASPLVGSTVALFSATVILTATNLRNFDRRYLMQNKKRLVFLLASGVAAGLGIVASFFALTLAPVVVINPLTNTMPLFTLLLSRFFLGHLEKITPKLMMGSLLIVVGVVLVTLGRFS